MRSPIEQRLFEAFQRNRGMNLSYADVRDLIDESAIATYITNFACLAADIKPIGADAIQGARTGETWEAFQERLKG